MMIDSMIVAGADDMRRKIISELHSLIEMAGEDSDVSSGLRAAIIAILRMDAARASVAGIVKRMTRDELESALVNSLIAKEGNFCGESATH